MKNTFELTCIPHRCVCERHVGTPLPEGMAHTSFEKCPVDLPEALRLPGARGATCCTMRGTPLLPLLSQLEADWISEEFRGHLSQKETRTLADDLESQAERIRERILDYLDDEDGAKPMVAVRVPTGPDGHWKHTWHVPRIPVRKAIDVLDDAASWYGEVAARGFGVVHEWHP